MAGDTRHWDRSSLLPAMTAFSGITFESAYVCVCVCVSVCVWVSVWVIILNLVLDTPFVAGTTTEAVFSKGGMDQKMSILWSMNVDWFECEIDR